MTWIQDFFEPKERTWEDFYRNRWSHDRVVRSTHGVNCTGSCSWNVYVKNGMITWEMQALDYPKIDASLPPYEPRGCQRGISTSWYVYSPLRVKFPLVRGVLWDAWRKAKEEYPNSLLDAWDAVAGDLQTRRTYQSARGKGGFRRVRWEDAQELIAAATLATIRKWGPDRVLGFSPIPAMSMVSYAAGARFLQLLGGVAMSFYDWYCDLPPASPEIWGEQTDVAESADWYESRFIAVVGSNVLMTRTPDAHFLVEARHRGAKVVVFSPDFSQTSKVADEWIPIHQGQDTAFWLAVTHVILKDNYIEKPVSAFLDYVRKNTDLPFLIKLEKDEQGNLRPGKLLRAAEVQETEKTENAEWKFLVWDEKEERLALPQGTVGHRWQKEKGKWNLKLEDENGKPIQPALGWKKGSAEKVEILVEDFAAETKEKRYLKRDLSARRIRTKEGEIWVTTGLEVLLTQIGIDRGLGGDYPKGLDDADHPYTPAWQEKFTGISASTVIRFAREWARTAEKSGGRCSVIIGAGANHWYHNNLLYRSCILPLILCGCVGKNGGGLNHYVGQEKLAPMEAWAPIAFATDWGGPPRLQNTPSFHYIHSDQWRYDGPVEEITPVADLKHPFGHGAVADHQVKAVRAGWLPCFPQFTQPNPIVLRYARETGAKTDEEIIQSVVSRLQQGDLKFSVEDPDAEASFPRVWFIWRGNAITSSAKGHEYFLKHYLGTHSNALAEERGLSFVQEVMKRESVQGKMDLVVDLNFRMDTSALYSDIVLPAATFYEKDDLSSTDMHTFIHPLQAAVPPCWESRSDWDIFRGLAKALSDLAKKEFNEPLNDLIMTPLLHDTPAEIAQPRVPDWKNKKDPAIPGKTMPAFKIVKRDYTKIYEKFISLGLNYRNNGLGIHGTVYPVDDVYDEMLQEGPTETWEEGTFPSLREARQVCETILRFSAETNGELAYRAFQVEEKKTGLPLATLAEKNRHVRYTFKDLVAQPRRLLTTPYWTGIIAPGRTYAAYCQNVEYGIPWRTLTGRQHLYLDHELYLAWGENVPTYKPKADLSRIKDLEKTGKGAGLVLNYLTPHGKWHIHSTFGDTLRMETLSRGMEPIWLNDKDAAAWGIRDNDWVEVENDHGVVVTRACVSARIPRGICFIYHATERTVSVPKAPSRGGRRAGAHNSLTRARLKPLFMAGGYGQFTYFFNYWGPQGINRDTFVQVRKLEKVAF